MNKELKEIIWQLVNSALAGALVFMGALSTGQMTTQTFMLATITAVIIFLTKFKDYWMLEEDEWKSKTPTKIGMFL